jgi:predicted ferric reductase
VAIASLGHLCVVKLLGQRGRPYRVAVNERTADRMWRVVLEPAEGLAIGFAAGPFARLDLDIRHSASPHPFWISSTSADRVARQLRRLRVGRSRASPASSAARWR